MEHTIKQYADFRLRDLIAMGVHLDEKVVGRIPFHFIHSPILPSPPLKRGSGGNTPEHF